MNTGIKLVRSVFCLAITWLVSSQGGTLGQQVELALPKDDTNQNSEPVSSVAFSPDGKLVVTGFGVGLGMLQEPRPGQTILWDASSGRRVSTIPALKDGVRSVAFSPDGKSLAVLEYPGIIRLIAISDGRELRKIETSQEDRAFYSIAFFPDCKRLAAGVTGELGGPGNDVWILDVASGKSIRILNGHQGPVASVAVSPDGKLLASGGWDGTARIWDASTGKCLKTQRFPSLIKKIKEAEREGDEPWAHSVAFSPDGRTLATAATVTSVAGEVDLWDTSTGMLKATLKGIGPSVHQVVFSPDGRLLATAGRDESIKLWNTATYQEIGTIKGFEPIAFSADGKAIAFCTGSRTIVIQKSPKTDRP